MSWHKPAFEQRLLLGILLLPVPAFALITALLLGPQVEEPALRLLALVLTGLATLLLAVRLHRLMIFPLYTLSNLLEALREGDYSLRGSNARRHDAMGALIWEVNALAETLRSQRLHVEEASALLVKVVEAIDIALFSFDENQKLTLINPAGERLLQRRRNHCLGMAAAPLDLAECLGGDNDRIIERAFRGGSGRFHLRRTRFRRSGRPHQLLVLSDLSRPLRDQEREAWQRLIRVLGHELNNSLAPIKSMAATLADLISRDPLPDDWQEDAATGLHVIAGRSEALNRFMTAYSRLARLPPPRRRTINLTDLLNSVAALTHHGKLDVDAEEGLTVDADPDQLEQAMINLCRNAAEANDAPDARVTLRAQHTESGVSIEVIDEGCGLSRTENLFVPFFTTKPGGSGIGLVLSRQIAEAHGGMLSLRNRNDRSGCIARLDLPQQTRP